MTNKLPVSNCEKIYILGSYSNGRFDRWVRSFLSLFSGLRSLSEDVLFVRCSLTGEPARIVRELKERGLVSSVKEAIVHGILAYYEKTMEQELRRAQLGAPLFFWGET